MKIRILLLILLTGTFSINSMAQDEFTLVKQGQQAPDFTYESPDGKIQKLSDHKGKVVWLTFFATWCGPCRKELPHLEKQVYEKYRNSNDFILLVIGREHSREELNKFIKDTGHQLPFIPDPKREIFSKYASQNIPRNFIIDKSGNIVVASTGFNEEEFESYIKKTTELLTGK
jgi:peroxiredoxin